MDRRRFPGTSRPIPVGAFSFPGKRPSSTATNGFIRGKGFRFRRRSGLFPEKAAVDGHQPLLPRKQRIVRGERPPFPWKLGEMARRSRLRPRKKGVGPRATTALSRKKPLGLGADSSDPWKCLYTKKRGRRGSGLAATPRRVMIGASGSIPRSPSLGHPAERKRSPTPRSLGTRDRAIVQAAGGAKAWPSSKSVLKRRSRRNRSSAAVLPGWRSSGSPPLGPSLRSSCAGL